MTRSSVTLDSMEISSESDVFSERRAIIDFDNPDQYVDVGHSKLAYWSIGNGPNLVLVHGWPISSATYRNLLPFLSKNFTCHLFDFPGAGKTQTGPQAPFGLKAHAKTLHSAIRSVGVTNYALLGHDSGAAIMQLLASEDRKNVRCMVMGDTETPGYHSFMMKVLLVAAKVPKAGELLFWSLRFKWLRHSNFGFGSAFKNKQLIDGRFSNYFLEPILRSGKTRRNQLKLLKSLDAGEVSELIDVQKECTLPIQLQWGSDDPYFLLADAKKMQRRFKGESEMHIYEGGKLFIHEEYPERFSKLATDFILRNY